MKPYQTGERLDLGNIPIIGKSSTGSAWRPCSPWSATRCSARASSMSPTRAIGSRRRGRAVLGGRL